jgi:hypothetical protein
MLHDNRETGAIIEMHVEVKGKFLVSGWMAPGLAMRFSWARKMWLKSLWWWRGLAGLAL